MGEFRAGTVTAIMGPSGSGKTTLLKLLGGQLSDGSFSGQRLVNGRSLAADAYDQLMRNQAFVPQEDTLLESLTVWATLVYAALLRLPKHDEDHAPPSLLDVFSLSLASPSSREERQLVRAAFLMNELGLAPSWNSQACSLSGGQRRRLSIAVEMLSGPCVMLLDEVTSGLDATSSLRVVRSLQKLSKEENCTVVMTIHQPRAEIFNLFDSLLLLGVGGKLIFSGPTAGASDFLADAVGPSAGVRLSAYDNHGDFIIDVLGLGPSEPGAAGGESSYPQSGAPLGAPRPRDEEAAGDGEGGGEVEMTVLSPSFPPPPFSPSSYSPPPPREQQLVDQLSSAFLESAVCRALRASIDRARSWARVQSPSGVRGGRAAAALNKPAADFHRQGAQGVDVVGPLDPEHMQQLR